MTAKGDDLGTSVDRSSAPGPEAQAAAARFLTRTGNADLLPILGLDGEPIRDAPMRGLKDYAMSDGRLRCTRCKKPTQPDGRCRRKDCGGVR